MVNFAIQSNLHDGSTRRSFHSGTMAFPKHNMTLTPELLRLNIGICAIWIAGLCLILWFPGSPEIRSLAYGLSLPGGGFAALGDWVGATFGVSVFLFAAFLWFGTGNVFAPILTWLVLAGWATLNAKGQAIVASGFLSPSLYFAVLFGGLASCHLVRFVMGFIGRNARRQKNHYLAADQTAQVRVMDPVSKTDSQALMPQDLNHLQLLLDRSLQPVDTFDGFEWRDQFQTAAIRYQVNFLSYAISLTRDLYMPAYSGVLTQAQDNLLAKQGDPRLWRYWGLENLWGNFRLGTDPVKRYNIMYSGFVGLQMALAELANSRSGEDRPRTLTGHKNGQSCFSYNLDDIADILAEQYENSKMGLLPCEPNWVYALCNFMSLTAVRGQDTLSSRDRWSDIQAAARAGFERSFVAANGQMISFRSNYTGLAPTVRTGGLVMQAFPCFFLNALWPDLARRQWHSLKFDMQGKDWRKACWPIDVGNYGLSRASSYGASALAARELGDDEIADHLIELAKNDCPVRTGNSAAYHERASLWANANIYMARIGRKNMLQSLISQRRDVEVNAPVLENVDWDKARVAMARNSQDSLRFRLNAQNPGESVSICFSGLRPGQTYRLTGLSFPETLVSTPEGKAAISIRLIGDQSFHLYRAE